MSDIDDIIRAWEQVREALQETACIIAERLGPAFEDINDKIEQIQRDDFFLRLPAWLPDGVAWWLAAHWPRRWL